MVHDDETRAAELPDAEARTSAPRERSSAPPYWSAQQPPRVGASATSGGGLTLSRVLPVAILMMVLLLAFIIVWMLMHRSASNNAVTTSTSTVASSPTVSTTHSSAPTSTAAGSAAPATSTTTLTSTATTQANGSEAAPPSQSSTSDAVAFPAGTVSRCGSDTETTQTVPIGDDKIRLPDRQDQSSCSFVRDVARQSRERLSQPNAPSAFSLDVYSAHRDSLIRSGDLPSTSSSYVPLDCTVTNAVAHCVSADTADESKVSIWVAN